MVLWHAERLKTAKSFGPCQPAQSAQADMCRYFLQLYTRTKKETPGTHNKQHNYFIA